MIPMNLLWLCALIVASAWWPRGRDLHEKRARMTMGAVLIGGYLAWSMPNPWLGAYTAVFLAGLFRVPSPVDRLPLTVYPALLIAAVYVLVALQVTEAWVRPVLWSIVACGLMLCAWWGISLYIGQGRYDKFITWKGITLLHLYEHQPAFNVMPKYCCGQGNENFMSALAGAAVASAVGLGLLGSWGAWLCAVLCALPCLKTRGFWWEWPQPNQGWGYLGVIGMAVVAVYAPVYGSLVASISGMALFWVLWRKYPAIWSGRQEMWQYGWAIWTDMGWPGKLIGAGPESWIHIFQRDAENRSSRLAQQKVFATHAHNEFVHELVERGVLGLGAMTGYLVTAMLGLLLDGRSEAHAVFVLGAMLIACMLVSFPVSLYHEVAFMEQGDVTGHGMPVLNIISLAGVLLTEGVLR